MPSLVIGGRLYVGGDGDGNGLTRPRCGRAEWSRCAQISTRRSIFAFDGEGRRRAVLGGRRPNSMVRYNGPGRAPTAVWGLTATLG